MWFWYPGLPCSGPVGGVREGHVLDVASLTSLVVETACSPCPDVLPVPTVLFGADGVDSALVPNPPSENVATKPPTCRSSCQRPSRPLNSGSGKAASSPRSSRLAGAQRGLARSNSTASPTELLSSSSLLGWTCVASKSKWN